MAVPTWSQALPDPGFYAKESLNRALTAQYDVATKEKELDYQEKKMMWDKAQTPMTLEAFREMVAARSGEEVADNHIKDLENLGAVRSLKDGTKWITPWDAFFWEKQLNSDSKTRSERMLRDMPLAMRKLEEDELKLTEKAKGMAAEPGTDMPFGATLDDIKQQQKIDEINKQKEAIRQKRKRMWVTWMQMDSKAAKDLDLSPISKQTVSESGVVTKMPSQDELVDKTPGSVLLTPSSTGLNTTANAVETSAKSKLQTDLSMFFSDLAPGMPKGILGDLDALIKGASLEDASKGGGLDIHKVSFGIAQAIMKLEKPDVQIPGVAQFLGYDAVTGTKYTAEEFQRRKEAYSSYVQSKISNALWDIAAASSSVMGPGDRLGATEKTQAIVMRLNNELRNPPRYVSTGVNPTPAPPAPSPPGPDAKTPPAMSSPRFGGNTLTEDDLGGASLTGIPGGTPAPPQNKQEKKQATPGRSVEDILFGGM